jgi:hypothetical protein
VREKFIDKFCGFYYKMGMTPREDLNDYVLYSYFELEYGDSGLLRKIFSVIRDLVLTCIKGLKQAINQLGTGVKTVE